MYFLVQAIPTYSVTELVTMIRSLSAQKVFERCPQAKKQLWGGEFWSDGYFASTVKSMGDENTIYRYVKGYEYQQLHQDQQLSLLDL
jgi:putative transposase